MNLDHAYRSWKAKDLSGFTLIELMIAIVIVAILTAVALPSYQSHVIKTQRTRAQSDFIQFAQAIEKASVTRFSYTGLADSSSDTGTPLSTVFPDQIPLQGDGFYNLEIEAATTTTFTLLATPVDGSLVDGNGRMTINNNGKRCWYENHDTNGGTCIDF